MSQCLLVDTLFSAEHARRQIRVRRDEKPGHFRVLVQRGPGHLDLFCINPMVVQEKLKFDYSLWYELGDNIVISKDDVQQFNASQTVLLRPTTQIIQIGGLMNVVYQVLQVNK